MLLLAMHLTWALLLVQTNFGSLGFADTPAWSSPWVPSVICSRVMVSFVLVLLIVSV